MIDLWQLALLHFVIGIPLIVVPLGTKLEELSLLHLWIGNDDKHWLFFEPTDLHSADADMVHELVEDLHFKHFSLG